MKIRIKGNSIRFRLTRSEVETLCDKGSIEEIVQFGEQELTYAVQRSQVEFMEASYKDNTIVLHISELKIQGWEVNETVGFESTVTTSSNTTLQLLLEKDFVCLDERLEDQSDNYPNPKMVT